MARVVVVGGGFGGMASAARLAKLGHEVTLLEASARLGGALGFVERDGFRWDTGPTHMLLPAVVRDLFRKSGRPLEKELDLVPVEPMRQHRFEDGTLLDLPSGSRSAQIAAIDAALGDGLGRAWAAYTAAFPEAWEALRRDWLERPWSAEHASKRARDLLGSRLTLHKMTAQAVQGRPAAPGRDAPGRAGGARPAQRARVDRLGSYVEQNFGSWTVPGGMGALATALAQRLATRRVDVRTGAEARDLELAADRVSGVRTDDEVLDADVVVVAVDPRRLPALARLVRRTMPAIPPVVAHLGIAGEVPDLPHEVVLHGDPTAGAAHQRHGPRRRARLDPARARAARRGHAGRAGPARDRRPRPGRGPRRPLAAGAGRGVARLAVRRALAGPQRRSTGGSAPSTPVAGRLRRRRARDPGRRAAVGGAVRRAGRAGGRAGVTRSWSAAWRQTRRARSAA